MAAPTPVSSLVHSSTLVTAGVYLLFRFRNFLKSHTLIAAISFIGLLTITIAGLRALYELDIKKIVALSTLSQLGLIVTSLGVGLYEVAFFHLLTHAFFKALLFITVGNIIHLSRDYQDLRKIKLPEAKFPTTLAFSLVANRSLCGLPFMAGFYSKDQIFELILILESNFILIAAFLLAIGLTVAYTVRFVGLIIWNSLLITHTIWGEDNDSLIRGSIIIL